MIYRGQGFLAVIEFGSTPTPFPPSPVSKLPLSQSFGVSPVELADERRGGHRADSKRPQESLALYKSFNTLWDSRIKAKQWVNEKDYIHLSAEYKLPILPLRKILTINCKKT
jgi:hypothetical protein